VLNKIGDDDMKNEEKEFANIVGHRILLIRTHLGLSQEELASKLSCARYLISKWESGKYLISTKYLFLLCKNLNIPLGYFDPKSSKIEIIFQEN
jgi:transcriptional regulator with XRE-family HTH domain